jgi:hypothetical protein
MGAEIPARAHSAHDALQLLNRRFTVNFIYRRVDENSTPLAQVWNEDGALSGLAHIGLSILRRRAARALRLRLHEASAPWIG